MSQQFLDPTLITKNMPKHQPAIFSWLSPEWRRLLQLILLMLLIGSTVYLITEHRQQALLPPLPDLLLREDSQPAVRKQLQAALDAARHHPKDARITAQLGMALQAYGYSSAAAICYRRAHALEPDFGAAYLLGLALTTTGEHPEAIAALQDALRLNPRYGPASLKLAELLMEAGELLASRKLLMDLLKQAPESPYVHFAYGRLLTASGDIGSAIDHLEQAIALSRMSGHEFGAAYYALGQAYRAADDTESAERQLALYQQHREALPVWDDPVWLAVEQLRLDNKRRFDMVKQLVTEEKLEQARQLLEQILEDQPDHTIAHANLMWVTGKLGDLERARMHYHAALQQNPDWAQAHHRFGALLSEQGLFEESRAVLERAVDSNPHHVVARVQLGHVLEQLGHTEAAEVQYRHALQAEPHHWQANARLARRLIGTGRYREAIGHLERIVEQDALNTPTVQHSMAIAYLGLGDQAQATSHLVAARSGAAKMEQDRLLETIDRELARLGSAAANQ